MKEPELTKLEYFAIQIMPTIIKHSYTPNSNYEHGKISVVKAAIDYAEILLEVLEKKQNK